MDPGARSTRQSQLPDPSPPVSHLSLGVQLRVLSLWLFWLGFPLSLRPPTRAPFPLQQLRKGLTNVSLQEIALKVLAKLGVFFLSLPNQGLSAGMCEFQRNCRSCILLIRSNSELAT